MILPHLFLALVTPPSLPAIAAIIDIMFSSQMHAHRISVFCAIITRLYVCSIISPINRTRHATMVHYYCRRAMHILVYARRISHDKFNKLIQCLMLLRQIIIFLDKIYFFPQSPSVGTALVPPPKNRKKVKAALNAGKILYVDQHI
jgi:hypothetical protein